MVKRLNKKDLPTYTWEPIGQTTNVQSSFQLSTSCPTFGILHLLAIAPKFTTNLVTKDDLSIGAHKGVELVLKFPYPILFPMLLYHFLIEFIPAYSSIFLLQEWQEALAYINKKQARLKEMASFSKNDMWQLVPLHIEINDINCYQDK